MYTLNLKLFGLHSFTFYSKIADKLFKRIAPIVLVSWKTNLLILMFSLVTVSPKLTSLESFLNIIHNVKKKNRTTFILYIFVGNIPIIIKTGLLSASSSLKEKFLFWYLTFKAFLCSLLNKVPRVPWVSKCTSVCLSEYSSFLQVPKCPSATDALSARIPKCPSSARVPWVPKCRSALTVRVPKCP